MTQEADLQGRVLPCLRLWLFLLKLSSKVRCSGVWFKIFTADMEYEITWAERAVDVLLTRWLTNEPCDTLTF